MSALRETRGDVFAAPRREVLQPSPVPVPRQPAPGPGSVPADQTLPPRHRTTDGVARARAFVRRVRLLDAAMVAVAVVADVALIAAAGSASLGVGQATLLVSLISSAWILSLNLYGTYDFRFMGIGITEYRRVVTASFVFFSLLAIAFYGFDVDSARSVVMVSWPVGLAALLSGRFFARTKLKAARRRGELRSRLLVVGDLLPAQALASRFTSDGVLGFEAIAVAVPDLRDMPGEQSGKVDAPVPVVGTVEEIEDIVARYRVHSVALAHSSSMSRHALEQLSWTLERVGVDLMVGPAMHGLGPAMSAHPVGGTTLLLVDVPRLSPGAQLVKSTLDVVGALLGLVVFAVPLAIAALAIRLTSPGPVLFRQWRVGRDGRMFSVLKLRTMVDGAEQRQQEAVAGNHADGLLFKADDDPRVTRVGRVLRRTSLDEVPQFWNVLRGEMSLVGPRPLAVDPDHFDQHEHRRHVVKPGITGLWQVEGRETQCWEEAVRLDLFYVNHWSLALDLTILARTTMAVLRGV